MSSPMSVWRGFAVVAEVGAKNQLHVYRPWADNLTDQLSVKAYMHRRGMPVWTR